MNPLIDTSTSAVETIKPEVVVDKSATVVSDYIPNPHIGKVGLLNGPVQGASVNTGTGGHILAPLPLTPPDQSLKQ